MSRANEIIAQINQTRAGIEAEGKIVNQGFTSTNCYILPLVGFFAGILLQKVAPQPKKLASLFLTSLGVTKHLSLPHK